MKSPTTLAPNALRRTMGYATLWRFGRVLTIAGLTLTAPPAFADGFSPDELPAPLLVGRLAEQHPTGSLAIGPDQSLWSMDWKSTSADPSQVRRYDASGHTAEIWSLPSTHWVRGLAIASDTTVFLSGYVVIDTSITPFLSHYSQHGAFIAESNLSDLRYVTGLALGTDGLLWTIGFKAGDCSLRAYDQSFNPHLTPISLFANDPGVYDAGATGGPAIDYNGDIWVTDEYTLYGSEVEERRLYSPSGTLRQRVTGIDGACAADMCGNVYVIDEEGGGYISMYGATGTTRLSWYLGEQGFTSIAIDRTGRLFLGNATDAIWQYGVDRDGDGLCDCWEVDGIQAGVGVARFRPPGCTPWHKDLYVEVDAMDGHAMLPDAVSALTTAFARVPLSAFAVPNPDGNPGVTLHLDLFAADQHLPHGIWTSLAWADFRAFKNSYFGDGTAEHNNAPLRAAKANVYRYCVMAHGYSGGSTGGAEQLGNDFFVTLAGIQPSMSDYGGDWQEQAGTFMHELGHTAGLRHGGADDLNHKPNYRSVMNYTWQLPVGYQHGEWGLFYSGAVSGVTYNELRENTLDERAGIGGLKGKHVAFGPPTYGIVSTYPTIANDWIYPWASETKHVDWNQMHGDNEPSVAADINLFADSVATPGGPLILGTPSPGQDLQPFSDWLHFNFLPAASAGWQIDGRGGPSGDTPAPELTAAQYIALGNAKTDCNGNGIADNLDIANGTSLDLDGDGAPDECESRVSFATGPIVIACPGGDADSVVFDVDVTGVAVANTDDPALTVEARRVGSGANHVHLWDATTGSDPFGQSVPAVWYDNALKIAHFALRRISGCGTLGFAIYANGTRITSSDQITVR